MNTPKPKTQKISPKPYDKNKKLIQLIHIAKSQLGFDDDTYRDILTYTTGKNSTKKMNLKELKAVLDEFKKKGFILASPKTAGKIKQKDDPQSRLIRHLWLSLHELGAVKNPSEFALNRYIKRQTDIDLLNWLQSDKKSQVIESLKSWQERILNAKKQTSQS